MLKVFKLVKVRDARLESHKSGLGIVGCKSGKILNKEKTMPCLKQGGQMG